MFNIILKVTASCADSVTSMVRNADNIGDISPILSVFCFNDILIGIRSVFVKISR